MELRERVRAVHLHERTLEVDAGVDIEVAAVYIAPAEGQTDTQEFSEAQAEFEETQTFSVDAENAGVVADHAAELLHATA
jgi:hypothetical protein